MIRTTTANMAIVFPIFSPLNPGRRRRLGLKVVRFDQMEGETGLREGCGLVVDERVSWVRLQTFPALLVPETFAVILPIISGPMVKVSHVVFTTGVPSRASYMERVWTDGGRISVIGSDPRTTPIGPSTTEELKCRTAQEMQSEFLPFVIEQQIAGYIHNQFANHLRKFQHVFTFPEDNLFSSHANGGGGGYVTLHQSLKSPEDRTRAVADVIMCLGEGVIPGIRNELYPVTSSYGMPVFFSLERAAAPYFGIKAYGIHMNGYVDKDGEKFLWIGKRSEVKPTFPGMLDHLAAGGLPHGITCKENLVKECQEEAGIPRSISNGAVAVGAVSYVDIDGYRYKRDVLFCYDLKLPANFMPTNEDGEVESFKLIPVTDVANIIRRTEFFKPNCCLVIIDFLFRKGYISPDDHGYLQLLQSLRSGDCS
ncbi:NUDIX hydrolase domain [Macleaya cordata]|uniref:NUDIX hydrolase domain n=1 Tax=Macleaya cordata TaxID=56857 RepID=A0A200PNB2_MACCD|nr:NUDIX hydrolase domain [Macleaya cordata]